MYDMQAQLNAEEQVAYEAGIRIFFFARQDFLIDGMVSILDAEPDNQVVACVEPGQGCVQKFETSRPDVLLLHSAAIEGPVSDFIGMVRERYPNVRIILFGQGLSDDMLIDAIHAGVHGYVNERMSGEHIKSAVRRVYEGETWFERRLMQRMIDSQSSLSGQMKERYLENIGEVAATLTPRETDVLCEVMRGLSIKEIAHNVHLSSQGVKAHLANLFRKFGVTNRSQLILEIVNRSVPIDQACDLLYRTLSEHRPR